MDVEESESKKSKVMLPPRRRQSETDIRDLDVERSKRDDRHQVQVRNGQRKIRPMIRNAGNDSESLRRWEREFLLTLGF